jgi:hypothetical protein
MRYRMKALTIVFALLAVLALVAGPAMAKDQKPNILVIWGDDIG